MNNNYFAPFLGTSKETRFLTANNKEILPSVQIEKNNSLNYDKHFFKKLPVKIPFNEQTNKIQGAPPNKKRKQDDINSDEIEDLENNHHQNKTFINCIFNNCVFNIGCNKCSI